MRWMVWLFVAAFAGMHNSVAAERRVMATAWAKPLPTTINKSVEAENSFRDCSNFERDGKGRKEGLALCMTALKNHGGD